MMSTARHVALSLLLSWSASSLTAAGFWTPLAPLHEARQELVTVAFDGKVYALGGITDGRITASVEVYDPATNRWSFVAPMPEPLHHSVAVTHGAFIYVLGGYGATGFLAKAVAYRYEPAADRWISIASLPNPRGAAAGAVIGDRMYVAGGTGPSNHQLFAYEPSADRWHVLASIPTPREHLAAGVIAGKLLVAGGRAAVNFAMSDLEEYDPVTNRWRRLRSMPTGRSGLGAAVVGGRMFVFGGEGNSRTATGVFAENESYEPLSDSWRSEPPMPIPRHGIGAAELNGTIFIPAGATLEGIGFTTANDSFTPTASRVRPVRRLP